MNVKTSTTTLIFLIILWVLSGHVCSDEGGEDTPGYHYIHRTWDSRRGLPQNTVYSIARGPMDYLWLGTGRGLVRFDGTDFTFIEDVEPAARSFSGTPITSLLVTDRRGGEKDLWIGTYGKGLARYIRGRLEFKIFDTFNQMPNNFIQAMVMDKYRDIWVGTMGGGLVRIRKSLFTTFNNKQGLSHNSVTCLLAAMDGSLWVGTEKGLNRLKNEKLRVYTTKDGLPENRITALCQDHDGIIWVGTADGVCKVRPYYRGGGSESIRFVFSPYPELAGKHIHALQMDGSNTIWIATRSGLYRELPGTTFTPAKLEFFNRRDRFFSSPILSLHLDREGITWVGTDGEGFGNLYKELVKFYDTRHGLSHPYVTTVYQDKSGDIWVGTRGGGLNRFRDGKFRVYTRKHGLSSDYIRAVCEDQRRGLWIGTRQGLNLYRNGAFRLFTGRDGLSEDCVNVIHSGSGRGTWIGTHGGGLNLYRRGRFEVLSTADGLSNNYVQCLAEDDFGNLWVGTLTGLNLVRDGHLEYFEGQRDLSGKYISDLYVDSDSNVWVATVGSGLYRVSRDGLYNFEEPHFLREGSFHRILENRGQHYFWMSSDTGIFVVSRDQLNEYIMMHDRPRDCFHLNEGELHTAVFSGGCQPVGWRMRDGDMWFPANRGVAVITPSKRQLKTNYPWIRIEQVLVDNRPVKFLRQRFSPMAKRKIEIRFSAPNYTAPGKIKYRYRLSSTRLVLMSPVRRDRDWIPVEDGRVVFNDLASGYYRLRLMASNTRGAWSSSETGILKYEFRFEEKFYETLWFYFLLLFAAVTVAIVVPYILRQRARERDRLSLFIDKDKYKTYTLPKKKTRKYLNELLQYMEEEQPYLDPELTLPKLAYLLGISKEELSQLINKELFLNFNAFLNQYRIDEAKRKLKDPKENQFVILKIAHDVGFNSKSSFNAVFKKITGLSPTEYRKKYQQTGE